MEPVSDRSSSREWRKFAKPEMQPPEKGDEDILLITHRIHSCSAKSALMPFEKLLLIETEDSFDNTLGGLTISIRIYSFRHSIIFVGAVH